MLGKHLIRNIFFKFGYDIRRVGMGEPAYARPDIWNWLRSSQKIKTVIDIGANSGEFAEFLSTYFGASKTYAIEPLPSCADTIKARSGNIKNLTVFSCALSDHEGHAVLFVNNYAPSSSLLSISSIHTSEFPETATNRGEVNVAVARLDDLIDCRDLEPGVLIKIDVQGLEHKVIRGGERVFGAAQCVMVEISFLPMYEDQPLFEEIHAQLHDLGFRLSGIRNQVDSTKTGQPLFMHCVYLKKNVHALALSQEK